MLNFDTCYDPLGIVLDANSTLAQGELGKHNYHLKSVLKNSMIFVQKMSPWKHDNSL